MNYPFEFDESYLKYLQSSGQIGQIGNYASTANQAIRAVNNAVHGFKNADNLNGYAGAAARLAQAAGAIVTGFKERKLENMTKDYQNASLISAAVNKVNDYKTAKEESINNGMADNIYATKPGGDRGDWGVTGSIYGQFRPNQMGMNSYYGMNQGMYYPSYDEGGEFDVGTIDTILNNSIASMQQELGPVVDFAVPPNPLTGLPTTESKKVGYQDNKVIYVPVKVNNAAKDAFNYYVNQKGLPRHVAGGIVGNLYQESGVNPRQGDGDKRGGIGGVAQWDPNRSGKLKQFAASRNQDPYHLHTQLDFILEEPGIGPMVLQKLKQSSSAEEAAKIFMNLYEKPNPKYAHFDKRASVAAKLYSGKFEEGGEYEMTKEEILQFMSEGGQIEFVEDTKSTSKKK